MKGIEEMLQSCDNAIHYKSFRVRKEKNFEARTFAVPFCNRPQKGFTLIELLVVIAIVSLLVSILLPSLTKAKELANSTVCKGNLHSIGVGLAMYEQDWDGIIPVAAHLKSASQGLYNSWDWSIRQYLNNDAIYACPSDKTPRKYYSNQPQSYLYNQEANWYDYKLEQLPQICKTPPGRPLNEIKNLPDVVNAFCGNVIWEKFTDGNRPYVGLDNTYCFSYYSTQYCLNWQVQMGMDHLGGTNYVMCDGHVEWFDNESMNGYWMFPIGDKPSKNKWHISD